LDISKRILEKTLKNQALLALADGSLFYGISIGANGQSVGEVVFNTAITGYQEILTDPSYYRQIVTLTYPHIGNTGTNTEDEESHRVFAAGLVIRNLPLTYSSWRAEESLDSYLKRHNVVAIAEIDTRQLTRLLREKGAQNGCLMAGEQIDEKAAILAAQQFSGLQGLDLAKEVSVQEPYIWNLGEWRKEELEEKYHVIAYDFGIKRNILRMLRGRGCSVTVVPAQTPAEKVLEKQPDGVFLSNGPGDPEPCDYAITAIQTILKTETPVFGICLGHQLLSLASGAKTLKMKFGHHGANHPVQNIMSKQVLITSQNHGFAVDEKTLPNFVQVTHRSLFDGSLQGIEYKDKLAFGFQGHPEASPGPHDIAPLFDHFIELMKKHRC
jgi:carbamoyl-phosphate synthase small subunit